MLTYVNVLLVQHSRKRITALRSYRKMSFSNDQSRPSALNLAIKSRKQALVYAELVYAKENAIGAVEIIAVLISTLD